MACESAVGWIFLDPTKQNPTLIVNQVANNTPATVRVVAGSKQLEPVVSTLKIVIVPGVLGDHAPHAAAHADKTSIVVGSQVQFSTTRPIRTAIPLSSNGNGISPMIEQRLPCRLHRPERLQHISCRRNISGPASRDRYHRSPGYARYSAEHRCKRNSSSPDRSGDSQLNLRAAGDGYHISGLRLYYPDFGNIVKWEWDWNNDGVFDESGRRLHTHSIHRESIWSSSALPTMTMDYRRFCLNR